MWPVHCRCRSSASKQEAAWVGVADRQHRPHRHNTTAKREKEIPNAWRLSRFLRPLSYIRFREARSVLENGDFGGQLALRTVTDAHPDPLALLKLEHAIAAQGFHMDEDVGRVRSTRNEAVAFAPIKPLHSRLEGRTMRLRREARGTRAVERLRRSSSRVVESDHPLRLQAFWAMHGFADDHRAFISGLEARLANAGLVQENISLRTMRRFNEPVPFGEIEPLDQTGHFKRSFTQTR